MAARTNNPSGRKIEKLATKKLRKNRNDNGGEKQIVPSGTHWDRKVESDAARGGISQWSVSYVRHSSGAFTSRSFPSCPHFPLLPYRTVSFTHQPALTARSLVLWTPPRWNPHPPLETPQASLHLFLIPEITPPATTWGPRACHFEPH